MTRRPIFWVIFGAVGVAGFVTALTLFSRAFPIISLDIEMDREAAISEAAALAVEHGWEPTEARSAASFGQRDPEVQTYVELEGGGRDAFVGLSERGIYQPYVWTVRRFAEGEVSEARVRFTPGGRPDGFRLSLPEDEPGTGNLSAAEARAVAEATAAEWDVDLSPFELLESSQQTQPGGRVDHTFVYQRTDVTVEAARFRLRIGVAGERPSELTHFVFVPDAFTQRYADMRSNNDAIALVSQSIFILLFVLGGAGIGTALLMRRGWIVWRPALAWGGMVALLFGLNSVNALPLAWMQYDTALSAQTFLLQQIGAAALIALVGAPVLAFFFLAAESLSRRAFPHHLQQWRFWSPAVAGSIPALGRTVGAYLLVGLELGYVVLFYLGTSRLEGWWSPADALVSPDLLATFQPWIQAVSIALFAGFWEESVFRAVPIACAALLGERYGRRSLWIWSAVAIQAVVFAAGHANYPQLPAYARVVELTLPAFLWGVVYLWFGLVPTILTHFAYNLSLISIPLFASEAPGILVDRGIVVLAGLVPLAVVLRARLGGWASAEAPEWAYNRAWTPKAVEPPGADAVAPEPVPERGTAAARAPLPLPAGVIYALGALGFALWGASLVTDRSEVPGLTETRGAAIAIATDTLEGRGVDSGPWTPLTTVPTGRGNDHRYVLEEAGADTYHDLVGTYLGQPRWIVRLIDFTADPEERVEELRVHIGPRGEVLRVEHELPEAREGARLTEDGARAAALAVVADRFAVDVGSLEEVGAEQTSRPNRTDWEFTFEDPSTLEDLPAEARITVELAGEEVVDVIRSVDVPEDWEREQRETATRRTLVLGGVGFLLVLGLVAADVLAVISWAKHRLGIGPLLRVGGIALVAMALAQANQWPATVAVFQPSQPWGLQVGIAAFGMILVVLVGAAAVGLAAALAHDWTAPARGLASPGVGVAAGMAVVGLGAGAGLVGEGLPRWPDVAGAVAVLPPLSAPLQGVAPFLFATTALLLLCGLYLRAGSHPAVGAVLHGAVVAVGLVLVPRGFQESLVAWVAAGLVGAAVVYGVVRLGAARPGLVPVIVGTFLVAGMLEDLVAGGYPGARVGAVLGVLVIGALVVWWGRGVEGAAQEPLLRP